MATDRVVEFRLYVAGDLPNSRRAVANLETFCREQLPDRYRIEILDVFETPDRALADRVLMTPQLIVTCEKRTRRLVGDLSDRDSLAQVTGEAL